MMRSKLSSSTEITSGKDAAYENFPVGSLLISSELRPHIHTFYYFARVIDDIADSAVLTADEKLRRLQGFEDAILGVNKSDPDFISGHRMHKSLNQTKVDKKHCIDLITAFKQDTFKNRYADWDELLSYCMLSAAPVGRYLLDLHGESQGAYPSSDALCSALQVLNHVQDCRDDFQTLNRVYLPVSFFEDEEILCHTLEKADLTDSFEYSLKAIINNSIKLINQSRLLPKKLNSTRLRIETNIIITVADHLSKKLLKENPFTRRIRLSKLQYFWCCVSGIFKNTI